MLRTSEMYLASEKSGEVWLHKLGIFLVASIPSQENTAPFIQTDNPRDIIHIGSSFTYKNQGDLPHVKFYFF